MSMTPRTMEALLAKQEARIRKLEARQTPRIPFTLRPQRILLPGDPDATIPNPDYPPLQIGRSNSIYTRYDSNEIMAGNNGVPSSLFINSEGGNLQLGGTSSIVTAPGRARINTSAALNSDGSTTGHGLEIRNGSDDTATFRLLFGDDQIDAFNANVGRALYLNQNSNGPVGLAPGGGAVSVGVAAAAHTIGGMPAPGKSSANAVNTSLWSNVSGSGSTISSQSTYSWGKWCISYITFANTTAIGDGNIANISIAQMGSAFNNPDVAGLMVPGSTGACFGYISAAGVLVIASTIGGVGANSSYTVIAVWLQS